MVIRGAMMIVVLCSGFGFRALGLFKRVQFETT